MVSLFGDMYEPRNLRDAEGDNILMVKLRWYEESVMTSGVVLASLKKSLLRRKVGIRW